MASSRKALREAFVALVGAIDGVQSALPYEPGPEALPPLPAVTMLSDLYAQADRMTGPATENTWGWEIRIYVPLDDYQRAQETLDDLVPAVLGVVRANTDLGGTCLWARIEDQGSPPLFAHESAKRYAWKTLHLRAEMEET